MKRKRYYEIKIILTFLIAIMLGTMSFETKGEELTSENENSYEISQEETIEQSQEENAKSSQEEKDIESALLSVNAEDVQEPMTQKPSLPEAWYTDHIFYSQTALQGIFSNNELYFYVPDYWNTKYVYAEIQYNVSELIQSVASSLTFYINDIPIHSYRISYHDGAVQTCYVEIPLEQIKEGFNSLKISAYARLYDKEGCADDFTEATWLSISDNSYIECGYDAINADHRISYYPYPFMSTMDKTGGELTIAISNEASDGEIAAAMNIMADLSSDTEDVNNIRFCKLSDLSAETMEKTIIVANYNNIPKELQDFAEDSSDLDRKAKICFRDDGNKKPVLLITSKNDDCLMEAAYMLMDDERVSQEKSSVASVNQGSADIIKNTKDLNPAELDTYTLEELAGQGLSFVGPFHQEQTIKLPFSESYYLADAGKISLNFRYSENLDFNRSLVTVYWGDVPAASKKLQKENSGGDELTFSMPTDVVGTSSDHITVTFDLEIPDLICTPRQEQMPWAYMSESSEFYLPVSSNPEISFDKKPSPFRQKGKFNDVLVLIPDNPTTEELNLYAQIIGMYGEKAEPYGNFSVKRVSEFSENDADYNIITLGTYENNEFLKKINDNLNFSYEKDGSRFKSNEKLVLSDNYASDIAILQLMKSPFSDTKGILAVTGVNNSLSYVYDFLKNYDKRDSLTQDCAIIDKEFDMKSFQFLTSDVLQEKPGVSESLKQNGPSILFTVVATAVMLMILIAVIIILLRIKMYHKKDDIEKKEDE